MAKNNGVKLPAGALANPFSVLEDESDRSDSLPASSDAKGGPNDSAKLPVSVRPVTNLDMHKNGADVSSWDDQVERALNEEENLRKARFFSVKRVDGTLEKVSPFLISKAFESFIGDVKIKKLKSGELLVEVKNENQALKMKKMTQIGNIPIAITTHPRLNTSRGVMSEDELLDISENEILENLRDQNVIGVKRINITRNKNSIKTKHVILTFSSPTLPSFITAGYLKCPIRPYIANPLRCFKCQRFGHSKQNCRGKLTCARCGMPDHESENCENAFRCVNCKNDHPAYSRACEKWVFEKEIQAVRTKQNLSYPEARKIVESRTPKSGTSYANATSTAKAFRSASTQTPVCIPKPFGPIVNGVRQTVKDKVMSPSDPSALTSEDKIENHLSKPSDTNITISPSKFLQNVIPQQQSSTSEKVSDQENTVIPSGSGKKSCNKKRLKPQSSNPVETRKQRRYVPDKLKSHSQIPVRTPQNKKQLHKDQFLKESKSPEEPLLSLHASDEDEMSTSSESENALGLPKSKS